MSAQTKVLRRMPQLDALRAFAVFGVLVFHFNHSRGFPFGPLGVTLFFVLSGFLITGLLLRDRQLAEASRSPLRRSARDFYLRRVLRIAPAYYLALALAVLLGIPPVRETLLWHLTYLSNAYFIKRQEFDGSVSHLWTLSVEEQFYFAWPWIILWVPRRRLLSVVAACTVAGPLVRAGVSLTDGNEYFIWLSPFSHLGSLGAGALLALARSGLWSPSARTQTLLRWALPPAAALLALKLAHVFTDATVDDLANSVGSAACGVWLVARASKGFGGLGKAVLEWRPLLYLGQISYGTYLFHMFVLDLFLSGRLPWPGGILTRFTVFAALSIGVAALSWQLVERPLRNLGRRLLSPRAERDRTGLACIQLGVTVPRGPGRGTT